MTFIEYQMSLQQPHPNLSYEELYQEWVQCPRKEDSDSEDERQAMKKDELGYSSGSDDVAMTTPWEYQVDDVVIMHSLQRLRHRDR